MSVNRAKGEGRRIQVSALGVASISTPLADEIVAEIPGRRVGEEEAQRT